MVASCFHGADPSQPGVRRCPQGNELIVKIAQGIALPQQVQRQKGRNCHWLGRVSSSTVAYEPQDMRWTWVNVEYCSMETANSLEEETVDGQTSS